MENKKYPIQGYAPGPYQNRCADCKQLFFGDKRALQCEPCAIKWQQFLDGLTPEQKTVFENDRAEIYKLFWELHKLKSQAASQPIGAVWVKASERPLIIKDEKGNWTCTDDGAQEFIAAVPYFKKGIAQTFWWIHHCVIENEIGLCIVGDETDDNTPAGWEIEAIEYWMTWPKNPDETPSPTAAGDGKEDAVMSKEQFDAFHNWLAEHDFTYDGEYFYDRNLKYYAPSQVYHIYKQSK